MWVSMILIYVGTIFRSARLCFKVNRFAFANEDVALILWVVRTTNLLNL